MCKFTPLRKEFSVMLGLPIKISCLPNCNPCNSRSGVVVIVLIFETRGLELHQSTAASTWWCGPRPRLGWVEMAVGLPEGPTYPEHSPSFFRHVAP